MASVIAPKHYAFFKNPLFLKIDFISDICSQHLWTLLLGSVWINTVSGVMLDSDIITLEMDPDAECVSINRPVTVMIDSNTSRSVYVIIKLLQGKLLNITIQ